MNINKKTVEIAIVVLILVATGIVFEIVFLKKAQAPVVPVVPSPQVQPASQVQPTQPTERVAKPGYKIVKVNNPAVSFSFEVPEKWLTETRNSREKQLSVEEMRAFLGTQYTYTDPDSGKSGTANTYYNGNGGINSDDVTNLSEKEIIKAFNAGGLNGDGFPSASVSSSDYIWYSDWNGSQIDFRIENGSVANFIAKLKQKKQGDLSYRSIERWDQAFVAGKKVDVAVFSPFHEDLEIPPREYYIDVPNTGKTLVISKQARVGEIDDQFEKDFSNLIQTLKIENPAEVSVSYFEVSELGFKFPIDSTMIDDLSYKISDGRDGEVPAKIVHLFSKKLSAIGDDCALNADGIFNVLKVSGKYFNDVNVGPMKSVENAKQFDGFYLNFAQSGYYCTVGQNAPTAADKVNMATEDQIKGAILNGIKNATTISQ